MLYKKKIISVWIIIFTLIICNDLKAGNKDIGTSNKEKSINRTKSNFNIGWLFNWGDYDGAQRMDYDDSSWYEVNTPNTIRLEPINTSKCSNYQGVAWYRKHFKLDQGFCNKKIFIEFEAIMNEATVWVNGHKMVTHTNALETTATHSGGYLPFMIDVTNLVNIGEKENVIAVRVNNSDNFDIPPGLPQENLDFNYFGGIYRDVYMISHDYLYVTDAVFSNKEADGGIFVTYEKVKEGDSKATVNIQTNIKNEYPDDVYGKVETKIVDADQRIVASAITGTVKLASLEGHTFKQKMVVKDPQLWSPDLPYLYTVYTNVYRDNKLVDTYETRIGIKWLEFNLTDGCLLNGKRIVLNGFNRHQEYAYIGYGASNSLQKRDAIQMKEAGFNICRIGHYPNDKAFMEACDELGILTVVPTPGWHYYSDKSIFKERVFQNVRDMIRFNRNHACIAFWEPILNEIMMAYDAHRKVYDITHQEFPVPYCYAASDIAKHPPFLKDSDGNYVIDKATGKFIDKIGNLSDTNYHGSKYNMYFDIVYGWEVVPGKCTFSREYCDNLSDQNYAIAQRHDPNLLHTWNSRGDTEAAAGGEQAQLWASNTREMHGLSSLEGHWGVVNSRKGLSGMCIWSGNDYNRGSMKNFSASGIVDLLRLPKFVYYLYQSQRSPIVNDYLEKRGIETGPMVYIANYWTAFSDRNVRVYTNCEKVKLYCNGTLLGEGSPQKGVNRPHPSILFENLNWRSGQLKAEGYIGEKKVSEDIVCTPEAPAKLYLKADLRGLDLIADGSDMVCVYVYVQDAYGNLCPDATNQVTFSVISGPGKILGDGDVRVGANPVNVEAGIKGVYIQATDLPGIITLKASADGLQDAYINITSKPMPEHVIKGILPLDVKERPASIPRGHLAFKALSIDEVKPINVALGASVVVSSAEKKHDASLITDGDLNSRWLAENESLPQEISIDLGQEKELTGAYFYWDNDRTSYWFDLKISKDGENWKAVVSNKEHTGQSFTDLIKINRQKARFVKIVVNRVDGPGKKAGLCEVFLLGNYYCLSDLPWNNADSGWGHVQKDKSVEGRILQIKGETFAKGLGTHSFTSNDVDADIVYDLGGRYSRFVSYVGVDDEKGAGTVRFQVLVDDVIKFDSGVMSYGDAVRKIDLDVKKASRLILRVKNGEDGNGYDHADWVNPRLYF